MKFSPFHPLWAIWFGGLIAPLSCALNAAILEKWVGLPGGLVPSNWPAIGVAMIVVTGPQGLLTAVLIGLWQEGNYRGARRGALVLALISPLFWLFCWHGLEMRAQWGRPGAAPLFGALIVPMLWPILWLLFALFARPPRREP